MKCFIKLLEFQWEQTALLPLLIYFLYCYESQFVAIRQKDPSKHSLIVYSTITVQDTKMYLKDMLTINKSRFLAIVKQIYPKELYVK